MYTLKKGDSISYVVEEHEVKLITDGSHEIADDEMGQKYMGTSGESLLYHCYASSTDYHRRSVPPGARDQGHFPTCQRLCEGLLRY